MAKTKNQTKGVKPQAPRQPAAGAPAAPAVSNPGSGLSISPDMLRAKMNVPAQLQGSYVAIVTAGRKIMASPQMAGHLRQLLAMPASMAQKLGEGTAALLGLIYMQTNKTMPKQLIIPAGIELIAHMANLFRQAGQKVTGQDIAQAIPVMVQIILQKLGVGPQDLVAAVKQSQMLGGAGSNPGAPPQGAPAPAAPPGGAPASLQQFPPGSPIQASGAQPPTMGQ